MKTRQAFAAIIILALFISTNAWAQTSGQTLARFSNGGVTFQYPSAWTLTDKSTESNQHLVLELKGTAAQIMVLVERTPSTQPGQRGEALRTRTNTFADLMTRELEKVGATVQRSEVTTDVGGVQADGLRLRANPGGAPGSVEVYSFVLGGRIVMLTLLRPDSDASAAAPAWTSVRSSLRVTSSATASASLPTADSPIKTAPASTTNAQRPARFAGLDYGRVNGSAYMNDYFGLRLIIPFGWRVQGQEVKNMLLDKGRDLIQTNNAQANAQMDRSLSNTVNLLTVFKYAIGSSADFNASLICGAEWLANPSMTADQYMAAARRTMALSSEKYYFRPVTTETIGGQAFAVMEVEMDSAIRQKYYAAIKKDYALFFILTYANEEDEAILRQALRSVRFS